MWTKWFLAAPHSLLSVLISAVGMYLTVLVLARSAGVRSFAEMSAFDVAVTVAIGSLIATSIVTPKPPLLSGMMAVLALYALQITVSRLRKRFGTAEHLVDNTPILLMGRGGRLLAENMAVARVTEDDLRRQLRKANVIDPARVQAVVMEGTGNVNVLCDQDEVDLTNAWVMQNVRDFSETQSRPAEAGQPNK